MKTGMCGIFLLQGTDCTRRMDNMQKDRQTDRHLSVVEKLLAAGCNKEARARVSVFACDSICVFIL